MIFFTEGSPLKMMRKCRRRRARSRTFASFSTMRCRPLSLAPSSSADQRHALRRAAEFADFGDAGAHQHALVGDQHDLVVGMHQRRGDDLAVALALLDRDHALGAAAVARVLGDACALAVAVLGGGQHALLSRPRRPAWRSRPGRPRASCRARRARCGPSGARRSRRSAPPCRRRRTASRRACRRSARRRSGSRPRRGRRR